jgi:hypothetical protein
MLDAFVNFVGDPDIHDGTIEAVEASGDLASVTITGGSGKRLHLQFFGVHEVLDHCSVGMRLYGLVEMTSEQPWRRFLFANWDEEDDASLEIICRDFGSKEATG